MNLENFFTPASVAVIGASRNPQKIGYGILKNIIEGQFKGKIYPVNPQAQEILNFPSFAKIADIQPLPDLAIIALPASLVLDTVLESAKANIKNFIIISAGFKEVGPEGATREKDLAKIVTEYNLNVLGPNCLGFINTHHLLNASFASTSPLKGGIAFASQSGALCTAVLDWAAKGILGFSYFVSVGNKIGISEIDLLELWENDANVSCIALYLEGIKDGRRFLHATQRISLKKPIIIISPGFSQEAQNAISSHTGSIATESQTLTTVFSQAGLIHAKNLEDLFDDMTVFANAKLPGGRNVAVVSNAGGPSILTTDEIIKQNLFIAPLTEKTISNLAEKLPRIINLRDPLDLVGDALSTRYEEALREILHEQVVDAVIILLTPQIMTEIEETASVIVKLSKKYDKPILTAFMGGVSVERGVRILNEHKIPNFSFPERAVGALRQLVAYHEWIESSKGKKAFFVENKKSILQISDLPKLNQIIEKGKQRKNGFLSDQETFEILKAFSFPIPPYGFANNSAGVATMARFIGLPVVLKISSPDLPHKSDLGGVKVNLDNFEKVGKAAKMLETIVKNESHNLSGWSFLIQKMIWADHELIIGAKKDPNFGHLIMFGAGGIYTEIYKDLAFRLAPLEKKDAQALIQETKVYQILKGYRGKEMANLGKIGEVLHLTSNLVMQLPEIQELDFNPLLVSDQEATIADAKIRV